MNAETLARLLEYFDLKEFFKENSPFRLLIIFGIMCAFYIIARFICAFVQNRLEKYVTLHGNQAADKKSQDGMDFDLFEKVMKNIRRVLTLIILYWGLSRLIIGTLYADFIKIVFTALCIWAAIEFLCALVPFNIDIYLRRRGGTLKTSQSLSLMPIVKGVIWAIGLTFLLDNLGFHVSTIIAGLGIVGVAVGLAGQAILADFFSYIVILLDKPFRIGDHVELGDGKAGDVEYMGPKTTHLRNYDNDIIVCANSEMTRGIIVNQGSIQKRIVKMQIGVDYTTPIDKLKKLSSIFQEVVSSFSQCEFERACLLNFGSSNLMFELLYTVSALGRGDAGINSFMNTRSLVNIAIFERFKNEGINMAFNTEHVLLTNLDQPPVQASQQKQ